MFHICMRKLYIWRAVKANAKFEKQIYDFLKSNFVYVLIYFFSVNKMYGHLFVAQLLIVLPVNIIIAIWCALGYIPKLNHLNQVIVISYLVNQFFIIFVLHLILAQSTKIIHRPTGIMFHLPEGKCTLFISYLIKIYFMFYIVMIIL